MFSAEFIKFIFLLFAIAIIIVVDYSTSSPRGNGKKIQESGNFSSIKKYPIANYSKISVIGYWFSEKKKRKLNWEDFKKVCHKNGLQLVEINVKQPLVEQGPFSLIIHKFSEYIVSNSDEENLWFSDSRQNYLSKYPATVIIDPLESIRRLLDRNELYRTIVHLELDKHRVFVPRFAKFTSQNPEKNMKILKAAKVKFPIICKPAEKDRVYSHQMALIFNEKGLEYCKIPAVVQQFVNHDATLFKVTNIGNEFQIVRRHSIRNFDSPNDGQNAILFDTPQVSSLSANSFLIIPDKLQKPTKRKLENERVSQILSSIRGKLNMNIFGLDIIIKTGSDEYGLIDVNIFPGIDEYRDFHGSLLRCLQSRLNFDRQIMISNHAQNLSLNSMPERTRKRTLSEDKIKKVNDSSNFKRTHI